MSDDKKPSWVSELNLRDKIKLFRNEIEHGPYYGDLATRCIQVLDLILNGPKHHHTCECGLCQQWRAWNPAPQEPPVTPVVVVEGKTYTSGLGVAVVAGKEPPVTQDDDPVTIAARDESLAASGTDAAPAAGVRAAPNSAFYEKLADAIGSFTWQRLPGGDGIGDCVIRDLFFEGHAKAIEDALRYYAQKEQHEANARIAAVVREPTNDEKDRIRLAMDAAYDEGTDGTGITNVALAAILAAAKARAERPR